MRDKAGRTWVVLATAEHSYLRVTGRLHPDVTRAHARDEWGEVVNHVHKVKDSKTPGLEVWRADQAFDRIYLIVEPVSGGFRVTKVRPANGEWAERPDEQPRPSAARPSFSAPSPPPAPSTAQVMRHRSGRVTAVPGPPRELPDVDGQILLLVRAELVREPRAGASEIAKRLALETRAVRRALEVIVAYEDSRRG